MARPWYNVQCAVCSVQDTACLWQGVALKIVHFIRSNNIKQYTVSKAVDTLAKKKPRVPFML